MVIVYSFVVIWCNNRLVHVSLILLGWELRVLYYCAMHTSLIFYAIPIFPFEEFLHLLVSSHYNS